MNKEKIESLAQSLFPQLVDIRRHLHANPELSFQEFKTSEFIQSVLTKEDVPFTAGWVGTGIMVVLKGNNPESRKITLRGDMDALPIVEKTPVDYASKNHGVMHACGHDVHTTCALGAAIILNKTRELWEGTVQILFQPGEEVLPGGANEMIKAGVFQNHTPNAIIGQHVFPELKSGMVGFRSGWYMASTDELYIKVIGKGGHGAKPEQNTDPVLIAAHLIVALQQAVSRWAKPTTPTVLSFGKIHGDGATNIIPDEVNIAGTFRTFDETWRYQAHEKIKHLAQHLGESMGAQIEVDIHVGYPALFNDNEVTSKTKKLAEEFLGKENVVDLEQRMTAEDFAYFAQLHPSCFYRLGTQAKNGACAAPVHNSYFDVDEESIITGTGLLAWIACKY